MKKLLTIALLIVGQFVFGQGKTTLYLPEISLGRPDNTGKYIMKPFVPCGGKAVFNRESLVLNLNIKRTYRLEISAHEVKVDYTITSFKAWDENDQRCGVDIIHYNDGRYTIDVCYINSRTLLRGVQSQN